jgi:stress response protein YsnF
VTQRDIKLTECMGQQLVDNNGDKIGKIEDVYLDEQTGRPEWFAVKTGFFGSRLGLVPTAQAFWRGDTIAVPYSKAQVKDAPHVDPDGHLLQEEEATLYSHYGLGDDQQQLSAGVPSDPGTRQRRRQSEDRAMTRSEEELVAATRTREAGRVRLVKYVETEHRNVVVPIRHERAKLVTEPITDENRDEALRGPDIRENVHEETLYEEEPVVGKRTVPKERVRLEKETKTEQRQVGADLRKERIKSEGDVEDARRKQ